MIRVAIVMLTLWVGCIIVMQQGGPRHVVAELTLPRVVGPSR